MRKAPLVIALVSANAHAAPRVIGAGTFGTWLQSALGEASETRLGAEGDIEQLVSNHLRLGGGLGLQRVWYSDDECFGFHGWRTDVYATAALDLFDPSVPAIHFLFGLRAGLGLLRRTPDCATAPHIATYSSGGDLAVTFGLDIVNRWRFQIVVEPAYGASTVAADVTVGLGYAMGGADAPH